MAGRAIGADLILIEVDHIGIRARVERLGQLEKRIRGQQIVVVEDQHKLASGEGQGGVRVRADPAIVAQQAQADARVSGGGLFKHSPHAGAGRATIGQAELPVRVALRLHRLDRGA